MLKRLSKYTKYFSIAIMAGIIFITLSFGSIIAWLKLYPDSKQIIITRIENELINIFPGEKISIGEGIIDYELSHLHFIVNVQDVKILNPDNKIIIDLPKINFHINFLNIITLNFIPSELDIRDPILNLHLLGIFNDNISTEVENNDSLLKNISEILTSNKNLNISLENFHLHNAQVGINSPYGVKFINIRDMKLFIEHYNDGVKIQAFLSFIYDNHNSKLKLYLGHNDNKEIFLLADSEDFSSKIFHDLLPQNVFLFNSQIINTDLFLNGKSYFIFDADYKLKDFELNINKINGFVNIPQFFEDIINIEELNVQAKLSNYNNLVIENFSLKNPDIQLTAKGGVSDIFNNYDINMDISLEGLHLDNLKSYWPITLEKPTRDWLVASLSNGFVPTANAKLKFNKDTVDKNIWPLDAITSRVNFENTNLKYKEDLPIISHAKGFANFDAQSVLINIDKAEINNAQINEASIIIPFVQNKINISGKTEGNVRDLIVFTDIISKNNNDLAFLNVQNIEGLFDSNIEIEFPLTEKLEEEFKINFSGKLKDIVIKDFYNKKSLENGNLNISFQNKIFHLIGNTNFDHLPFSLDYKKDFNNELYDHKITLSSDQINFNFIRSFDIKIPEKISNDFGKLKLVSEKKDNIENIEINFDMTNMDINLDDFTIQKEKNIPATLNATITINPKKDIEINNFSIKSDNVSTLGRMTIDKDTKKMKELKLENAKLGNNLFSAVITSKQDSLFATINGKYLDLSKFNFSEYMKKNTEKNADNNMSNITIKSSFEKVAVNNNIIMNNTNLILEKNNNIIQKLNLGSNLPRERFFMLKYEVDNNIGNINLTSNDIGSVFQSIDLTNYIKNGEAVISGKYDIKRNSTSGNILIKNYSVRNAPVLAHILTISSFTGIVQRLNGEGVVFTKLTAPFTYQNSIFNFIDAKTYGASIGITFDGDLNNSTNKINLNGTITPAYEINSLIADIPIVGEVLSGGEQGVLAVNYKLRGTIQKPKVTINPLSILAPGFLRKIFEQEDTKKVKSDQKEDQE